MNPIVKLTSLVALAAVMLPCLAYFLGLVGLDAVKWTALAGTIVWFLATPMWMSRDLSVDAKEVEI